MGQEKVASAVSFDKLHDIVSTTNYIYGASGALTSTTTKDSDGHVISEAAYSGRLGGEKIQSSINYDVDTAGNPYFASRVSYIYDASGALSQTVTTYATDDDLSGSRHLNVGYYTLTSYSGLSGQEKVDTSTSYEDSVVKSITHYQYAIDGALSETLTYKADGTTKVSETYFKGLSGFELSDFSVSFNSDGSVKGSSFYFYGTGSLRAKDSFKEDSLSIVKSYKTADFQGDESSLELESISYYQGKKGNEIVGFAQSYGLNYDTGAREIQATTIYEYDTRRTLKKATTYFAGLEGSSDISALILNFTAEYIGDRGRERISLMRGTTAQYPVPDAAAWDYYIRTNFTYDSDGRNTGYTEATHSSANALLSTATVEFSSFDSKDRYSQMVRTVADTGEVTTENSYVYDSDDHLVSYKSTVAKPGEDTKYREISLDNYVNNKARTITTWTLDSTLNRTGDYSSQSNIVYGQYGRIASYTITSSTNSNVTTSNVFDIVYDKDKTIEDKVTSPDEVMTFGPNYSVRDYKYNSKGENETIVITNGDYISVYNKDNINIYFAYTPAMEATKATQNASLDEPEGSGPRASSAAETSPFIEALREALKGLNQAIDPNGVTKIEYTSEGDVSKITDAKGNVLTYSSNQPTELRDSTGALIANISYTTAADGSLTVSMAAASGAQAVFVYDKDNRRVSVNVVDANGVTTRLETYAYTKDAAGKVTSAVVHREYLEGGSTIIVDKTETYDSKERVTGIFTRFANPAGKYYIETWTGSYDDKDDLITSKAVEMSDDANTFADITNSDAQSYLSIISSNNYNSLSEATRTKFANNGVVISIGDWSAAYNVNKTLQSTHTETTSLKCVLHKTYTETQIPTYDDKGDQNGSYTQTTETDTYETALMSHTVTDLAAQSYDSNKNLLKYIQTETSTDYTINSDGVASSSGTITKVTSWEGVYENNMVTGYTQTVHTTNSDGVMNLTETTVRSDIKYYLGNVVSYKDVFVSTAAPDKTVETTSTDMTYVDGKITGYTQVIHTYGAGLDNTAIDQRYGMAYDSRGRLIGWTDDITTSPAPGDITDQTSIVTHKVTSGVGYDDLGRIASFTEVATGLVGVTVGQPMEWRQITTQRIATSYNADNLVIYEKDIIATAKAGGEVVSTKTSEKSGIQYDSNGRENSYTSTVDGQSSRVDYSIYNGLGQLTFQYTTIDSSSHNEVSYYYDEAGNLSKSMSKYYYSYSRQEMQGKDIVTIRQSGDITTWNDKYGAQISQTKNQHVDIDVQKNFWSKFFEWVQPVVDAFLSAIGYFCPQVGIPLKLIFDTLVSLATGTFNWGNFATQLGLTVLQLAKFFDYVYESLGKVLPALKSILGASPSGSDPFSWSKFGELFARNLLTTFTTEVINRVGPANGWSPFLTSAVSNFTSLAMGYSFDHSIGGIKFLDEKGMYTIAAMQSLAIASIDYYVSKNPSTWANVLAPLAREAISTYSGRLEAASPKVSTNAREVNRQTFDQELKSTSQSARRIAEESISNWSPDFYRGEVTKYDLEYLPEDRTFDIQKGSNLYQLAQEHFDLLTEASYNNLLEASKAATPVENRSVLEQMAAGIGESFKDRIAQSGFLYMGEMSTALLTGKAFEITSLLNIAIVDVLYNSRDGEAYISFDISNGIKDNIESVFSILASDAASKSYNQNLSFQEGDHVKVIMTEDGSKAYLQGEVGYDSLKGASKEWADRIGLSSGDKVSIEMNLKTGDIYMYLNVKDSAQFLSQKGFTSREDISKLKQIVITSIGSIDNLKLDLAVRINNDVSEIVGASVTIDSKADIKDDTLRNAVSHYASNFGLNTGFDIVLAIDMNSSKVNVQALSLKLDNDNIKEIVNELNGRDPRQQRLGYELQSLVKLAGNDPKNLDRVYLTVDNKGEYKINVRVLSSVLMTLPGLIAKLGLDGSSVIVRSATEGGATNQSLFNTTFTEFTINVANGAYSLDLGLKCEKFEPLILRISGTDVTRDSQGRKISEDVYDKKGDLVTVNQYGYSNNSLSSLTQAFFAQSPDGTFNTFKLITSFNSSGNIESAHFDGLTQDLAGSVFKYVIDNNVLQFNVIASEAKQSLILTGDIPTAQLGLKLNLANGASYEPYSIPVEIKADGLYILGKDTININGVDQTGFELDKSLLLFNGSKIAVGGSAISIVSGSGFFCNTASLNASSQVQGSSAIASGDAAMKQDQPAQLNTTVMPIKDIFAPALAWADTTGSVKAVLSSVNLYTASSDGTITPIQGSFDIVDNGISPKVGDVNVSIGQVSSIRDDAFLEKVAPKYNLSAGTIKEFITQVYGFNGAPANSALDRLPLSTFVNMLRLDTNGVNTAITSMSFNEAYDFAIRAASILTSRYPDLKDSLPIALIKDAALQVVNWASQLGSNPNAVEGLSVSLSNFINAVSYLSMAVAMDSMNVTVSSSFTLSFASKASEEFLKTSGWDSIGRFWSRDDSIAAAGVGFANPVSLGANFREELGKDFNYMASFLGKEIQYFTNVTIDTEEKVSNKLSGLGYYSNKDFAIDKALAIETSKEMNLDGAIVFAVGNGPIQQITRFGELSGFGENKTDLINLFTNPLVTLGEHTGRYLFNAFSTSDPVPHHVGMARVSTELDENGNLVNYVMQINPEGETKVPIEQFAKDNLTIKIIMPKNGTQDAAALWDSSSFDPDTNKSTSGRTYDFMRLVGWGDDQNRGTKKAICSEDVYFMREAGAKLKDFDPLPGVELTNRITPWDEYKARAQWDEDMVQEFVAQNPERAQEIKDSFEKTNPDAAYKNEDSQAVLLTTLKTATAESSHDIWNVASLGALDKIDNLIKENPTASTGTLLAKSVWAGVTSVTNTLTLGFQDAIYYSQMRNGPGIESIWKGITTHAYNLTPIEDFSAVFDVNKSTADRLQGLFMGISKSASLVALGASMQNESITPQSVSTDNIAKISSSEELLPKGTTYQGRIVRGVLESSVDDAWSITEYNINSSGRYTKPSVGGLYTSADSTTVIREVTRADTPLSAFKFAYKDIEIDNMLDLTSPDTLNALGLKTNDLIQSNYALTQKIGDFAIENDYNGIIAPSARNPGGKNIILLKKALEKIQ